MLWFILFLFISSNTFAQLLYFSKDHVRKTGVDTSENYKYEDNMKSKKLHRIEEKYKTGKLNYVDTYFVIKTESALGDFHQDSEENNNHKTDLNAIAEQLMEKAERVVQAIYAEKQQKHKNKHTFVDDEDLAKVTASTQNHNKGVIKYIFHGVNISNIDLIKENARVKGDKEMIYDDEDFYYVSGSGNGGSENGSGGANNLEGSSSSENEKVSDTTFYDDEYLYSDSGYDSGNSDSEDGTGRGNSFEDGSGSGNEKLPDTTFYNDEYFYSGSGCGSGSGYGSENHHFNRNEERFFDDTGTDIIF